ncbi:MAG: citrate/2-methylcitrate synthase, partial [Thiohalobacteraceae bacterium]
MKTDDTSLWDRLRGVIRSRIGGWRIGQDVRVYGRGLLGELLGNVSYFQLLVLNTTGRLPERRVADWIEGTFMCLSWPDARIWCNQIATYAGASRTTPVAAVTAGLLASESRMYGPGTVIAATGFIVEALAKQRAGASALHIIDEFRRRNKTKAIPGFGRPVAKGDERVVAMKRLAQGLGFKAGPHLALADAIEVELMRDADEAMNLAGYIMAFMSDLDYSAEEIHALYAICVEAGLLACYREAVSAAPDSFMPM